MATSPMNEFVQHLRRTVLLRDGAGLTDGQLLGCYVEHRDEAAFAALVRRHGPMVWGVCGRLLSQQDAEDAFQATFLVLVRKAASIVPRERVANWLYGVARQTALQARRTDARRRAREKQVSPMPEPAVMEQDLWRDVQPLLDQELGRLPGAYREVIVLCDLEGKARREVARQLGLPEGTVASRLARARAMLAKRLARHGLAVSGGALAAVLFQQTVSAGVPSSVVDSTIQAAGLVAAGKAAASGAISVKVAALTGAVMKAMLFTKLRAALAIVLILGFVAAGATFRTSRTAAGQGDNPPVAEEQVKAQLKVEEKDDARIAWGKEVDGVQVGLVADPITCRQGEKVKLTVKLRNVGKAEVTVTYGLLRERAPDVTTADGGRVRVSMTPFFRGYAVPTKRTLKPGEAITLYEPEVAVDSEARAKMDGEMRVATPTICAEPGKYKIAFGGMIQSHRMLKTGTVEFEVKGPKNVTAWGKEVDGVQVGIHFGEDRIYKVGETVTLIVRLRNNGKTDVSFTYDSEHFQKNPPLITDADGKAVAIKERNIFGIIKKGSVAPGKEVDLCELALDLRPDADRKKDELWTLYGTGKFVIRYKDVPVVGEPRLDGPVTTHATGKLDLEIKSEPPTAATEKK